MRTWEDVLHTLTAIALTAPILAFYFIIASEAFVQPTERYIRVAPSMLAQLCSAFAKDK